MKAYFLSHDRFLDDQTLYPRIPFSRMKTEDKKTKRISCSLSIMGALYGVIHQFAPNEDTICNVYSFDVEQKDLIFPNYKDVSDNYITGEMWVTCPVTLKYETSLFMTTHEGVKGVKSYKSAFEEELEDRKTHFSNTQPKINKVDNISKLNFLRYIILRNEEYKYKISESLLNYIQDLLEYKYLKLISYAVYDTLEKFITFLDVFEDLTDIPSIITLFLEFILDNQTKRKYFRDMPYLDNKKSREILRIITEGDLEAYKSIDKTSQNVIYDFLFECIVSQYIPKMHYNMQNEKMCNLLIEIMQIEEIEYTDIKANIREHYESEKKYRYEMLGEYEENIEINVPFAEWTLTFESKVLENILNLKEE